MTFCDRASLELFNAIRWADIIHLQNASPDVALMAKLAGKPLVMTIHNFMQRDLSVHRLVWRVGAALADARWYNSQFVWDTWEPRSKRAGSSKVPTVSKLPQGWVSPDRRSGFVFIGRWIANKGIDTLVQAYSRASIDRKEWPLVLMGDGPMRAMIEAEIRELGLPEITVRGFVDEDLKAQVLQSARWAVVPPNTNEDFGLTAIEARSLGVPCIITRDGGLPEAAGKQALVCPPADPEALARLLEIAAQMPLAEYAERSERTRSELRDELLPMSFYPTAYRRVLRGEPLPA